MQIEVERAVSQQKPRLATLPSGGGGGGGGGVGAPEVFGRHPQSADTVGTMLHLLVDTSTWLDLSKRRDGQRWIVALRVLVHQGEVELIVPPLVIDE
ncbi:hypothetical protein C0205_12630 (plasmid) [Micrococcus luteus]|nr:hypothetical protein C0205_12630 [Micrococcus luteus]